LKSEKVEVVYDSSFPYNVTYSKDISLGGKTVGADFSVDLFAGTNFDCNQQHFNYEGLAKASTNLEFLGWQKEAFLAEAIYGKANGQVIGDEILVKVWDDVIYQKKIPTLDCREHVLPIAHTQKGLSVSYTVWISIIPVTFRAGATLGLELDWGWQVCDSDLSALVELIPKATFTVTGDAEINLLIIRAGLELSGSLNGQLRPQGYIHGSNCSLGLDLKEIVNPFGIDFGSYYAWKHCKFLIFDCSWGDHHKQTWFHWQSSPVNRVIYEEDWKIQP